MVLQFFTFSQTQEHLTSNIHKGANYMNHYSEEELKEAIRSIESTISKCEKVLPKLRQGTSQHTLLIRRIKAFQIALSLLKEKLEWK